MFYMHFTHVLHTFKAAKQSVYYTYSECGFYTKCHVGDQCALGIHIFYMCSVWLGSYNKKVMCVFKTIIIRKFIMNL